MSRKGLSALLMLLGVLSLSETTSDQNITIAVFISGITETEEASGFTGDLDGRPFRAAVELAKDLVNDNATLLPGYRLEVAYTDAKVSSYFNLYLYTCTLHGLYSKQHDPGPFLVRNLDKCVHG